MEYYLSSLKNRGEGAFKEILDQMGIDINHPLIRSGLAWAAYELGKCTKSCEKQKSLNWDHIVDTARYATGVTAKPLNDGVIFEGTLTDAGKEFFDKIGFTEEEKKYMENDVKATKAAYELGKKARTEMFKQVRPKIKDVIFNDPATIVFWDDGTKTVVKVRDGDRYDPETGIVMACAKKLLGAEYSADIHTIVNTKYRKHWFKVDIRSKSTGELIKTATLCAADDNDAIIQAKYWLNEKCMDPCAEDKYIFQIHEDKPKAKMFRWHVEAKEDKKAYSSTLAFEVSATNADDAEVHARSFIDIVKKWKGANLNYKITVGILGEVVDDE